MSIEKIVENDSVIKESQLKADEFCKEYLSADCVALEIYGKENITRRDKIKSGHHGKAYYRSRWIKYMGKKNDLCQESKDYLLKD